MGYTLRERLFKTLSLYVPKVAAEAGEKNDLTAKVINAAILAGLAFFKALAAVCMSDAVTGAQLMVNNPKVYLVVAGLYAGLEFFSYLAMARGLTFGKD